jgi:transcriptional regulator with XRE-family HTH domain
VFAKVNELFLMIDDRTSSDTSQVLAANLRRLRIARHLSLSQLARATGMSKATLSGIENRSANPTVETLAGLIAALRVSFAELLEAPPLAEIRVVRSREPRATRDGTPRRLLDAISADGSCAIFELILSARRIYEAEAGPSGARAYLYVLAGRLIAGPVERPTELESGDYASFPADVAQIFETTRDPARALLLTQALNG